MSIGVIGASDHAVSPEVLFEEAGRVGSLVLKTAKDRSEVRISGNGRSDSPNITFLEPEKLSQKYIEMLESSGEVTQSAIDNARIASLALSLEAGLQIIAAKSVMPDGVFIEDLESLQDMEKMLGVARSFVSSASVGSSIRDVVMEVTQAKGLDAPEDPVVWANDTMARAHERMSKKAEAVASVMKVRPPRSLF